MPPPFTFDRVDHIVLRVRDLAKSMAFYEMLGADVSREVPAGTVARITPSQSIILQGRPEYVPAEIGAVDHINLTIRASSIFEVADYLRGHGVEFVTEPEEGRMAPTVNVKDPDGYVLEIRIGPDR